MEQAFLTLLQKVSRPNATMDRKNNVTPDNRKRRQEYSSPEDHESSHHDEAGEHLREIQQAAEQANRHITGLDLPFRFRVYQDGDHVFIELIRIRKDGSEVHCIKKNITHHEFRELLAHLECGEGLFLDRTG